MGKSGMRSIDNTDEDVCANNISVKSKDSTQDNGPKDTIQNDQ